MTKLDFFGVTVRSVALEGRPKKMIRLADSYCLSNRTHSVNSAEVNSDTSQYVIPESVQ